MGLGRRFGGAGMRRGARAARGATGGPACPAFSIQTTHSVVGSESFLAGAVTPVDVIVTSPTDTVFTVEAC